MAIVNSYAALVKCQNDFFNTNATKDLQFRKQILNRLLTVVRTNEQLIFDAIYSDLRKSKLEAIATETGLIVTEIKVAISQLDQWAKK
jgi:aldehyde dehydrogenase (NAD+)